MCVLYKYGGIYVDIPFSFVNGYSFKDLMDKERLVVDAEKNSIYNAMIISKKQNPFLLKIINNIVKTVKNRDYNVCPLDVTGPRMIGRMIQEHPILSYEVGSLKNVVGKILFNGKHIINTRFEEYDNERKDPHYHIFWYNGIIYYET